MPPKVISGLKPPGQLVVGPNLAEDWKLFEQHWKNYSKTQKLSEHEEDYQVAVLLNVIGDDAVRIYNGFTFTSSEENRTVEEVLTQFRTFAVGTVNVTYERFKLNNRVQEEGELFDSFLTSLKTLMKTCAYCSTCHNSILKDRIVIGIRDKNTQRLLLRERSLDLDKAIDTCHAAEDALKQGQAMKSTASSVNKVKISNSDATQFPNKPCLFCNKSHVFRKELCPAYGKTCNVCKQPNHFAGSSKCTSQVKSVKMVNSEAVDSDSDTNVPDVVPCHYFIGSLGDQTVKSSDSRAFAKLNVCEQLVIFQLDPGSEVDTINEKYVHPSYIKSSSKILKSWDGGKSQVIGECYLPVKNPKNDKSYRIKFVVVSNDRTCLIGLKTCERLNFVTLNKSEYVVGSLSEQKLGEQYPNVFDGKLGRFEGKVTLRLREGAVPRVLPARNIPFALQEEVIQELHRLIELGVLSPIDTPTDWVSQMAVARKPTGKLRICIDPGPLNEVLLREHYKLPTMEDILDKMCDTTVFSKFDVENAYWHCQLDDASSQLVVMATPIGRLKWNVLPFGLNVSGEIFQRKLTEALSGLEHVTPIADDIGLLCHDHAQHDVALHKFLQRCSEKGVKLKLEKMEIDTPEMVFHGHVFSTGGMKPDVAKIISLRDMPPPTDVAGVLRFCGLAQYLARFLPNLADKAAPLRLLTQKGSKWEWGPSQQSAFDTVKKMACEAPILAHYQPNEPLTLQVDASSYGLGAALLQNDKPVAYASRSLTKTEQNYAQIEKECLSVVYGLERFDQYTFGRHVLVENDHKPLEMILKKTLVSTPKRLQAMRMRINRYDTTLVYKPGKSMILADTLSRAYPELSTNSSDQSDFEQVNSLYCLPVTDQRMKEIYEATCADDSMQTLIKMIHDGWPVSKDHVPETIKPYFAVRDCLSIQDGIVLKGERLVIPPALRSEIKKKMHSAHLGKDSMLRRAREIVYWPGMTYELIALAESCTTCVKMSPKQCNEPLMPRERGNRPWQIVGCDLFELDGKDYLVTVDFYSNFWEVDFLSSKHVSTIILALKKHFARYGSPEELVSDCSPFESAEFQRFCKEWDIVHNPSSPGLSRSNGKSESAVKAAKKLIKKCTAEKSDPYKALLELRNTPMQGINLSPAQIMMSRRTRSAVPCSPKQLKPQLNNPAPALEKKVETQAKYYDKKSKPLTSLYVGQPVYYDKFDSTKRKAVWEKGVISEKSASPRRYSVDGNNGGQYVRNRIHIRNAERTETPSPAADRNPPPTPEIDDPDPAPIMNDPADEPNDLAPEPPTYSPRPTRSCGQPSYLNDYDCSGPRS